MFKEKKFTNIIDIRDRFEEDFALSLKSQPYINEIYNEVFPIKNIIRFPKGDKKRHILDREFHIDVNLELQNGIKLTGQEKVLRERYSRFNTFTIEFYQNRHNYKVKKPDGTFLEPFEKGEFFNLGAQFYFHGYWDKQEMGLEKWYLIKMFDFLTWLRNKPIEELEKTTKPSTSNASFYYKDYDDIPLEFIYAKYKDGRKMVTGNLFDISR
ncbi:hypothetical protein ES705_35670 [subsurface metagenome]